ncbi:MAG: membrane protein insertion efficiency factor YidD [Pseudomonadota bacterium]|nr:membrane protein insertion efficiency factor YidD [Pseudomonadota bacterium]
MLCLNQKKSVFIKSFNSRKCSEPGLTIGKKLAQLANYFLFLLVGAYRTIGTTYLGGSCKFHPSCSQLALDAIELKNPTQAVGIIFKRLLKCHPFSNSSGFDPISKYLKVANAK